MRLFYRTLSCRTSDESADSGIQPMLLWMLGGVGAGTVFWMQYRETFPAVCTCLLKFCGGLVVSEQARTLWNVYCCAALPVLLLLVGLLYAGSSAVGQPLAAAVLVLRGAAVGIAGAECFSAYGLRQGVILAGTMILPDAFLTAMLLAYAARDAQKLSNFGFGYLFRGSTEAEICSVRKNIHLKWLAFAALTLAVTALHTALVWGFAEKLSGSGGI